MTSLHRVDIGATESCYQSPPYGDYEAYEQPSQGDFESTLQQCPPCGDMTRNQFPLVTLTRSILASFSYFVTYS